MDMLCADKAGTLTRKELKVTIVQAMGGVDDVHVLAVRRWRVPRRNPRPSGIESRPRSLPEARRVSH